MTKWNYKVYCSFSLLMPTKLLNRLGEINCDINMLRLVSFLSCGCLRWTFAGQLAATLKNFWKQLRNLFLDPTGMSRSETSSDEECSHRRHHLVNNVAIRDIIWWRMSPSVTACGEECHHQRHLVKNVTIRDIWWRMSPSESTSDEEEPELLE